MRVLVCGGRDYNDRERVYNVLDQITLHQGLGPNPDPVKQIIHGGASGADYLADCWAKSRGVEVRCFPAKWRTYGKPAGPIRNQQMLDEGKPDLVVAFPGHRGTPNMVARAKKAGVKVIEVDR